MSPENAGEPNQRVRPGDAATHDATTKEASAVKRPADSGAVWSSRRQIRGLEE
ncbi:hypothetical protein [Stieleria mannarensis]|uniref:hypothetical protein n=1 Tax=Stieleria mannarensis TaxID=2755585 RepID=UPI0016005216|nr:hypothetical protein [Rhodopirellula sp. JC639]